MKVINHWTMKKYYPLKNSFINELNTRIKQPAGRKNPKIFVRKIKCSKGTYIMSSSIWKKNQKFLHLQRISFQNLTITD